MIVILIAIMNVGMATDCGTITPNNRVLPVSDTIAFVTSDPGTACTTSPVGDGSYRSLLPNEMRYHPIGAVDLVTRDVKAVVYHRQHFPEFRRDATGLVSARVNFIIRCSVERMRGGLIIGDRMKPVPFGVQAFCLYMGYNIGEFKYTGLNF